MPAFEDEYKKLNKAQKEAVDTIDGPVMVVAGPGTGKTQILAIRIANILIKTDTKGDSVLCLTFTNSGVKAMRERLRKYIGAEASKVHVSTFHSFGMDMMGKYFPVLGLSDMPQVMDESDMVALSDEILEGNAWQHIRPRSDNARYFRDLKGMISLLKRERMSPKDFQKLIEKEIAKLKKDPDSVSSRGATKGELKKDVQRKIESLERSLEVVTFYELYEKSKAERNLFDYDDVLENLVKIIEESEEAAYYIREQYQYVLIDEHQDSSGVQNEFLERVWGEEEKPNIFAVGDDRQLIYGFSGASLEYFENFEHMFGKAKRITLFENYRSTGRILDSAHALLPSALAEGKLKSNLTENHPLRLVEAYYPRDEIIAAGLEIKEKIKKGMTPEEIAILVPKNAQVRSAMTVLADMGVPVASGEKMNFFDSTLAQEFLRVLKIIAYPADGPALARSFFDTLSGITPLEAHEYLFANKMRTFSLLGADEDQATLFGRKNATEDWMKKIKSLITDTADLNVYSLIQKVGSELLLANVSRHEELVIRIEIIRTLLHLALFEIEKDPKIGLREFLNFIDRIKSYGENIPLAVFAADRGVRVLTLHGSKGLEFDYVWIAHMDEKSLSGGRQSAFSLPESLEEKTVQKDEEVLKRQLYVAITRAKHFCTISYALSSYTGGDLELAHIIADLSTDFEKQSAEQTEEIILKNDPKAFVEKNPLESERIDLAELKKLVAKDYEDRKVSVSLLNNFFECPWRWYFRNLLQLPEPKTESLEFGNIIHSSIDKILGTPGKLSEKEIKEIIRIQTAKTGFGGEKKQQELTREAYSVVLRWTSERLPKISKNRENEQSVSVSDERFPHLSIYGKVDLIEMLGGPEVRVTDFKTGSVRKKSDIEKMDDEGRLSDYMRQLAMYSYLLTESPKWKKNVSESKLEFVEAKSEKEAFYSTFIDRERIDLLVRDVKDYDTLVSSGEWLSRPCHFKSYGRANAACEYCELGKIYK